MRELAERRFLIIERKSFDAWAIRLDGKNPLAGPARPMQPLLSTPAWAKPTPSPVSPNPVVVDACTRQTDVPAQVLASDAGNGAVSMTTAPAGDVPSDGIIAACPVLADERANTEWWKTRMPGTIGAELLEWEQQEVDA